MKNPMSYRSEEPTQIKLEKLRIGLQGRLSPQLLDAKIEIIENCLVGEIEYSIRGYVWAESEKVRRQEVKYPADWWQSFKLRWFPNWLVTRYPVKYIYIVMEATAIYPNFKPSIPGQECRIIISTL